MLPFITVYDLLKLSRKEIVTAKTAKNDCNYLMITVNLAIFSININFNN